jgi:hypothetical protein
LKHPGNVGVFSPVDLSKEFPDVWECSEIRYAPGTTPFGSWRVITAIKRVLEVLSHL